MFDCICNVLQGLCADKAKVYADHKYTRAVYYEEPCKNMSNSLRDIRNVLHDQLALSCYSAQFSRLAQCFGQPFVSHCELSVECVHVDVRSVHLYFDSVYFWFQATCRSIHL